MTTADPAHIAALGQGVKYWNQWRREHIEVRPNLFEVASGVTSCKALIAGVPICGKRP